MYVAMVRMVDAQKLNKRWLWVSGFLLRVFKGKIWQEFRVNAPACSFGTKTPQEAPQTSKVASSANEFGETETTRIFREESQWRLGKPEYGRRG